MTQIDKSEGTSKVDKQDLDDVTGGGRDPKAGHTPPGVRAQAGADFALADRFADKFADKLVDGFASHSDFALADKDD